MVGDRDSGGQGADLALGHRHICETVSRLLATCTIGLKDLLNALPQMGIDVRPLITPVPAGGQFNEVGGAKRGGAKV